MPTSRKGCVATVAGGCSAITSATRPMCVICNRDCADFPTDGWCHLMFELGSCVCGDCFARRDTEAELLDRKDARERGEE